MKLYVVRHGQTEWNYENRVCGKTDVQLTDKGAKQAEQISKILHEKQIKIIITSPLTRAVKTAEIISKAISKNFVIENRLIEQDYGVFEGTKREDNNFKEAKRHFPSKLCRGESILQVAQRVFNVLDEIKEKYGDNNVLIVTHGGVFRVINAYFNEQTNEEFYHFHVGNCEVKEYKYQ
ncbi:putative phosphoglycerate mutase [Paenibacillus sp. BK033]|uniref:histidine phosphatase family protein n=1 Tax=Paenibacillus sp. BK033 TaxID=2512133 RepID=UPI0010D8FAF5|nr:histidine phosphatase family protein [Paenibacillus sp. BK033]TCM85423.1 putative phosphoglycerate mutase [Paenibacillus sp. BK033]